MQWDLQQVWQSRTVQCMQPLRGRTPKSEVMQGWITSPSKLRPSASEEPYCSAVPEPNSPPAASSNLFSVASPGAAAPSSAPVTTAAAAAPYHAKGVGAE